MPFVGSRGVRIHYEIVGDGHPLVLHHGFTDSCVTWEELGYVERLAPHRRLILIDARGHGLSDKPHDPAAYVWYARADDVIAVLDAERVERADFYGVSMGGSVGIALAARKAHRFTALAIGAADDAGLPGPAFAELLAEGSAALVAIWEGQGPLSDGLRLRLAGVDLEAMIALANRPRLGEDELVDAFAGASVPRMLMAGELDAGFADITHLAESLPTVRFVPLPGLNHYESFRRADASVPHLIEFLDDAHL